MDLTSREKSILDRELKESREHAMPEDQTSNTFGDGSSLNSLSRPQATLNQQGASGIISRRVFEPRKGWKKPDQESM